MGSTKLFKELLMPTIYGLNHVQIAIPKGGEDKARQFYSGLLGLNEIPKPANLLARGGAWFECGPLQLHLGVEAEDFKPVKKAHPALMVDDLEYFLDRLQQAGYDTRMDEPAEGYLRAYTSDPFGNSIELMYLRPA